MNTYVVEVQTFYNSPYFTTHVEVDATTEDKARKAALNEPVDYEEGFDPFHIIQSVEKVV